MKNSEKAANLYDWIISRIHLQFTEMADNIYGEGIVTQDERKALSGGIGRALDAWNVFAEENLAQLKERRPYDEAPTAWPEMKAIKMLGANRVGGYMMLWGSEKAKDLDQEWFTPQTEELTAVFKAMGKLPYLYNHATDGALKTSLVGTIDVMAPDDTGLWYEAQLDQNNKYMSAIQNLVKQRALGTSSGTLPGARQVAKSGQILRWPIVEGSMTPTPADPRQMQRPIAEIKSAYTAIGLDFPQLDTGKGDEESRQREIAKRLGLLALLELESTV